jgi:hypothetical protein
MFTCPPIHRPTPLAVIMLAVAALACNAPLGSAVQTDQPVVTAAVTTPPVETVTASAQPSEPAQPTAPPAPVTAPPTAVPNAVQAVYAGISFYYDYSLASSWDVEVVPPPVPDPNIPQEWLMASHYAFTLRGYPLTHIFLEPQILVFPTQAYSELNPLAAQRIAALRQLLAERPAAFPQEMPFLPVLNAAQVIHVQHAYLNFQNGSGVRYLTQHDQAFLPINNEELIYTFQGLTSDGGHLIVVTMPISHPSLPDDHMQVPGGDPTAFANNFESYLADITAQLESAAPDSFAPSILLLDTMVQSLLVAPQ